MPTTNSPKAAIIPVRLTPAQAAQIAELTAAGWGNQSDVIRTAIDRMHQQEARSRTMTIKRVSLATLATEIADAIGDSDDKSERDALAADIFEWLAKGNYVDGMTAEQLAAEWELANEAAEMRAPTYNGGYW